MEWISVAQQLPESNSVCIIGWNRHCYIGFYNRYSGDFSYLYHIDGGQRVPEWDNGTEVTHWMPLPEPPKKRRVNEDGQQSYV